MITNGPTISAFGSSLHLLGLSLMIGGMLALGAFTAPVLFKAFDRLPAGEAMTMIFRRYDVVLFAALAMVLFGEGLRVVGLGSLPAGILGGFRYGLLALLTGLLVASIWFVNPQMEAMQKVMHTDAGNETVAGKFRNSHQLSEKLYKFELLVAVLLLALYPWVQPGVQPALRLDHTVQETLP